MVVEAPLRGSVSTSVDDVFIEGQLGPADRGRGTVAGGSSEAKPALRARGKSSISSAQSRFA